ncbi:putative T7SS-secreted protein [Luteimicrobium subarcticum]|uniref:Putative T7SS secretion signal domain-containing protein n=1 Tax=Luteimicrobium subarcticum TaxID=620910 RepID=A0A2M8WVL6_9MICO|nr:hypothetical protein [Luteimicrobium subarcticum]PJI94969.1 hypothetical protein CLV34_0821 [Luteimicrobium subarcticum]
MNWEPLAPADPVPGDPSTSEQGGRHYLAVADAMDRARTSLTRLDGLAGQSEAIDALRERASKVRDQVVKAQQRYRDTGNALVTYAAAHRTAQDDALALWHEAVSAQDAAQTASRQQTGAQSTYDDLRHTATRTGSPLDYSAYHPVEVANRAAQDAQDHLDAVVGRLSGILEPWHAAARKAAGDIDDAVEADGLNDGWWEKWGSEVAHVVSDWAGNIAGVLGIAALVLAWVPVLGEVLGVLSLIAGVVALVADLALLAHGEGSVGTVVLDALGVLSFGAGQVLSRSARVLSSRGVTQAAGRLARIGGRFGNPTTAGRLRTMLREVPELRSSTVKWFRPTSWNTWVNQGARSFKGLRGRAWWMNFVGQGDAARAYQSLRNVDAVEGFARGARAYPATMKALGGGMSGGRFTPGVFGGTLGPFALDSFGAGSFVTSKVGK